MKLELAPYRKEYLAAYCRWRRQPATVRYNPLLDLTREEIARTLAAEGSDLADLRLFDAFRWFILAEGEPIGSVSLKGISRRMGHAEIGYGLDEAWHGRGVGTAAVRMLVGRAFRETGLRRLFAYVHAQNVPSRRLLERLGFQQEGLLREHYLIDGEPADEAFYGLLRREWSG